eukprot:scaffold13324_cov206-Alexandrium_tamarense.AAC.18
MLVLSTSWEGAARLGRDGKSSLPTTPVQDRIQTLSPKVCFPQLFLAFAKQINGVVIHELFYQSYQATKDASLLAAEVWLFMVHIAENLYKDNTFDGRRASARWSCV